MQHLIPTLTALLLLGHSLSAQTSRFEVARYAPDPEAKDFHTEESGLNIEFEVRYQLSGEALTSKNFDFVLEVLHPDGQLLLQDQQQYINLSRPFGISDPTWLESNFLDFFIPYKSLSLPAGRHQLTLRLSAENKTERYPDFWEKTVPLTIPDFASKSFEEQVFTVEGLQVYYNERGFGVDQEGIALEAKLRLKYGPDQVTDKHYDLFWVLETEGGNAVYRSEQAASIFHRDVYVPTRLEPKKLELFARYDEIRLNGPADVRLIVFVRNESGQLKTIHTQSLRLEIPQKYAYEAQEFSLSGLQIQAATRAGAQGILCRFSVDYKYSGPLQDPTLGPAYFYHWDWKPQKGIAAFDPKNAVAPNVAVHQPDRAVPEVEIFVPFRSLLWSAGAYTVAYSLRVTDKSGQVQFPELAQGTFEFQLPQRYLAYLSLNHLEVVAKKYDSMFGNFEPDLYWQIHVGGWVYGSEVRKNSLTAATGVCRFYFVPGDEILLKVWDEDQLASPDDHIIDIEIPYAQKGYDFSWEGYGQGELKSLSLIFDARPASN